MSFILKMILILSFAWGVGAEAALWPDGPWLNHAPLNNAIVSGVAFVSPNDMQFYRIMNIWKKFEKRYGELQINFLVVAMGEQGIPADENTIRNILKTYNFDLPLLLDLESNYSKLWHAYVTPTVDLVLRDGHLTSFDAGNFDPFVFEKALQKVLKENRVVFSPAREFNGENDFRNCAHAHTYFLGERFGKAWGPDVISIQGSWSTKPLWLEGPQTQSAAEIDMTTTRSAVGVLGEAKGSSQKIIVSLDGNKIPQDIRGRDVQEDKSGNTFVQMSGLKMYEVISHSSRLKESGQKLALTTDSRNLKLRAIETLPSCLEVE